MDGNCGYRVIAISMGFGHDDWRTVRKHLLDELRGNQTFYEDPTYGAKRFRELTGKLLPAEQAAAPPLRILAVIRMDYRYFGREEDHLEEASDRRQA
ncbi:hypothetical protein ACLB2K_060182 [Fragaria x ananassa]